MGVIDKLRGTVTAGGFQTIQTTSTTATGLTTNLIYWSSLHKPFYYDSTGIVLLSSV